MAELIEQKFDLEKPLAFEDYLSYRKKELDSPVFYGDSKELTKCLMRLEAKNDKQRDELTKATNGDQNTFLVATVYVPRIDHDAMVEKYREKVQRVTLMHLFANDTGLLKDASLACDDMSLYLFPISKSPSEDVKAETYWFKSVPLKSSRTLENGSKEPAFYRLNILSVKKNL